MQRGCLMNKKRFTATYIGFFLLAISLFCAASTAALDYPKSPVQIVVPFAPGGATDILWRAMGDFLGKKMEATVVIINKAGGSGVVGLSSVVNSKPDGYTLSSGNSDMFNLSPLFTPDIPYDPLKDFTFIAKLAIFPALIAVRTESPFKTMGDLVAFAKANPKKLKAGVPGFGTTSYMSVLMFNDDAKVEIFPVPFGGGGEVVPNLLGGHIDVAFCSVPTVKSQFVAGRVRILAILSAKRHPIYKQIPTAAELGYAKTIIDTGIGLVGPRALPTDIVKKWEDVAAATMKDAKVVSSIEKLDYVGDFKPGEVFKKDIVVEGMMFKDILSKSPGAQKK